VSTDNDGFIALLAAVAVWLWWLFLIILVIGWVYDWLFPGPTKEDFKQAVKEARIARGAARARDRA